MGQSGAASACACKRCVGRYLEGLHSAIRGPKGSANCQKMPLEHEPGEICRTAGIEAQKAASGVPELLCEIVDNHRQTQLPVSGGRGDCVGLPG